MAEPPPWRAPSLPRAKVRAFARALRIKELLAEILLNRGISEPDQARCFLEARLCELPDPQLLADIDPACERILAAVDAGERICIYGDYDVDGLTSTALLWGFLKEQLDLEAMTYIPRRLSEGYSLNLQALDKIIASGVKLLITVDNGSSALEEIAYAQQRGLEVIIIDHHPASFPEPRVKAHLTPMRPSCCFPYKDMAAVGVSFLLTLRLRDHLRCRGQLRDFRCDPF